MLESTAKTEESTFVEVPLQANFFHASSFFPMPVVVATTVDTEGHGNLAPYSLLFPLLDDDAAMLQLQCRASSKTAQNLRDTGRVTLNFVRDEPHYVDEIRRLAQPASSADKVSSTDFTLTPVADAPALLAEAFQIFVCTRVLDHPRESCGGDNDRFVLRIEQILMHPYWHQALGDGLGVPQMVVDFGFRAPTADWLNRPSVNRVLPRLRPRFELPTPLSKDAVLTRLQRALDRPGARVDGYLYNDHVRLKIPQAEQTKWSPQLELDVKADDGTKIYGRLGPHPNIWTMFMAMHGVVGLSALGALVFGVSQLAANEPSWALWGVPIALALNVFIAGAAYIGQGLASDDTHRLRTFIEDALS